MKKRYIIPIAGALASVGVGYMLKGRNNSSQTTLKETLTNAGKPDQVDSYEHDQLENAKMVSEGSQFGVQYYNRVSDNVMEEVEKQITE